MTDHAAIYEGIDRRVGYSDADDDWEYADAMRHLTGPEQAVWTTRFLEAKLADGGWYLVFGDEHEFLIEPAARAYEALGLAAHAAHLRHVLASGYGDQSDQEESERLDEAWAALEPAEPARVALLTGTGPVGDVPRA